VLSFLPLLRAKTATLYGGNRWGLWGLGMGEKHRETERERERVRVRAIVALLKYKNSLVTRQGKQE
jgi:hypothetical protein